MATDIYIKKEFWISTSNSERECIDTTLDQFIGCYRQEMLKNMPNITCWIPLMKFLRFPRNWPDCKTSNETAKLKSDLEKAEFQTLQNSSCITNCKSKHYKITFNYYSLNAFDYEWDYNSGYYYIYFVYSTLTVKVVKEEHVYDLATALVAIGQVHHQLLQTMNWPVGGAV